MHGFVRGSLGCSFERAADEARAAEVMLLKILIADDEPIARPDSARAYGALPSLEVAGEAGTGAETLAGIFELKPDMVLLDLQMPELGGLGVVRSFAEAARRR